MGNLHYFCLIKQSQMNPKCRVCAKTVYFAEKISYGPISWHKACFKCEICNNKLTKGTQLELDNKIVCPSCYEKNKTVLRKSTKAKNQKKKFLQQTRESAGFVRRN